jgi:hypothetical protein
LNRWRIHVTLVLSGGTSMSEFKEIPGFIGYRIDKGGRLQSRWKVGGQIRKLENEWHDVSGWDDGSEWHYRRVGLIVPNRKRPVYKRIHQLVALVFIGEAPPGADVCHGDNDGSNNNLDNLRYDTRKGNFRDKIKAGTHKCGESVKSSRLKEPQIIDIRQRVATGENRHRVAREFGIQKTHLDKIISRKLWRHVP